ncbi:tRNA (guanosine(46)-N7)-methyltransferase TrmB [Campylobacter lari]|uniref:tRNA (guanosine(46)-N7)-methyltransferase TrmB n=1 Tax=Campylobacter sp. CNRCH_2007_0968H TaxID=2911598 RepID=UPI00127C8C8B|nr:tRNA (guanosine(46)-N7)-methyltransferase TrmB [Campylobacter sp. CNRCH_2007_0968H]EAJ5678728.1 tRNA (guanosine(46)-N7)-methyltransferase TrmB [Campylobacter lari]EAK0445184.1 tRNA (guanosine(46)-N7)-methyltransferase TrmB [Campylobacter lari]EAK9943363.1 tRNA (guanosine(46)-N7)-methyltransferase TrmB [Campylobacter lari]EID4796578.1 tRNA (guanosine(46)-N7)-methyltransferase TrmB [Campylobacter lari]MCV3530137.1 tRNA (guanosine(46)-N7)-methyltransferase TrmB [Campylobacter sp. CNRCH_2007_09
MPNFKCKILKEIQLPFEKDGVEFLWLAKGENVDLLFTRINQEKFFLQIKKDEKSQEWLIKGEKHTKPSQIGYLQKALLVFKENFTQDVACEAVALKHTRLIQKTPLIANDLKEILEQIKNKKQIYIEIGFGSGRHLLYQARQNPNVLIIGIEIYTPALEQVAKLALSENLNNVLLIETDARLLLSVLESNLVDKIFLHFPVPWDKKPHRRVVGLNFVNECARVLKEDGQFELRTDSFLYFDFTLETFLTFSHLKALIKKNENLEISSKYEDRWKRQNKDIYDLIISGFSKSKSLNKNQKFAIEDLKLNTKELACIKKNFKNEVFKGEDFFLHFEKMYIKDEELVIKIAFGAFYKPEHVYIVLNLQKIEFIFEQPFKTKENLKAIEKLREILYSYIK